MWKQLNLSIFILSLFLISCGVNNSKQEQQNRTNVSGVDYSEPYHIKHIMDIPHSLYLETYYSVNLKGDSVTKAERDSINPRMIMICDSLKNKWNEAVITVMKETAYTNRLEKEKEKESGGMNPFITNNVYLLKYTFRDKENVYVLRYDGRSGKWVE